MPAGARLPALLLALIAIAVVAGPAVSPHTVDGIDFAADWGSAPTLHAAHWCARSPAAASRCSWAWFRPWSRC
jgi:hypothetical protein